MLHLNISDDITTEQFNNMEMEFDKIRLTGSNKERSIIKFIENGTYNNDYSFIDRFGLKLDISEMSTGCKAALCVANNPKKVFNLIECGVNAQDVIITTLKEGNIIIRDRGITIVDYSKDGKIDVELDGYRFTNTNRLNYYIFEERPFKPEKTEGVEYVQK